MSWRPDTGGDNTVFKLLDLAYQVVVRSMR